MCICVYIYIYMYMYSLGFRVSRLGKMVKDPRLTRNAFPFPFGDVQNHVRNIPRGDEQLPTYSWS